jgi:diaminopimelate epimerase
MQIGGNSFLLIDDTKNISQKSFSKLAEKICSKRYGVGASGIIFCADNNVIHVFDSKGKQNKNFFDALFCAARYYFDSGKITQSKNFNQKISFLTREGIKELEIISSREFALNLGSPFSLLNGKLLTEEEASCMENITLDKRTICLSGIHIAEDFLTCIPGNNSTIPFSELYFKLKKNYSNKKIYLSYARQITKESILVKTLKRGLSTCTGSAASALLSLWYAGTSDKAAVCIFQEGPSSLWKQQEKLSEDKDNSRKLTVLWDTEKNEITAIGTGGYIFEGFFDYGEK